MSEPTDDKESKELPPNEEVKAHLKSRGTWVRFAYMLLFTLPMWAGLLEDDIEDERHRYEAEE